MEHNFNILALYESDGLEKVIIYAGRFQPFHKGHKSVYEYLTNKYPYAKVYISTSDKTDSSGRYPFNFEEKKKIMTFAGIPEEAILEITSPYNISEYVNKLGIDVSDTAMIFNVSEKDMANEPYFQFPETGLKVNKSGKESALQRYREDDIVAIGHNDEGDGKNLRAYVDTVPTTPFKVAGHDVNSATEIRALLGGDPETAKQVFVDLYDKYNEEVFNLVKSKFVQEESTMEQIDLKRMRELAGLQEAPDSADLQVDTGSLPSDDDDYGPGFKEKSVYDQLGKVIDSESIKDVVDAEKYKPVMHIKTDDGDEIEVTVPEAMALRSVLHILEKPAPKEKFLAKLQSTEGFKELKDLVHNKGLVSKFSSEFEEGQKKDHNKDGKIDSEDYLAAKDKAIKKAIAKRKGEELEEGGNAFDIAMTDAEGIIQNAESQEDALKDLEGMMYDNPQDMDEKYANEVIQDYITMVLDKGLEGAKAETEDREPEMQEENNMDDLNRMRQLAGLEEDNLSTGDVSRNKDAFGFGNLNAVIRGIEKVVKGEFTSLNADEKKEMQMLGSKLKSGLADPENKAMLQRIFGGEEGEASDKSDAYMDYNRNDANAENPFKDPADRARADRVVGK